MAYLALLLSFSVGFLSLSQEIVWVRLVSFGQQGRPHAFSIVLAAFLIGIALGAIAGRRLCQKSPDLLRSAGIVLLMAAAADFAALYLGSSIVPYSARRLLLLVIMIALTAGLKGVLFPIVHHLGAIGGSERVGRSISRIYFGNVMGSTLGPIVTGFWLLDHVDVEGTLSLDRIIDRRPWCSGKRICQATPQVWMACSGRLACVGCVLNRSATEHSHPCC